MSRNYNTLACFEGIRLFINNHFGGAFTVGAVNQSVWQSPNPAIRGYSGQGPSTDGRQKPDLVAPDGTASLT